MRTARSLNFVLVYRFDRLFREVRLFLNAEHELRQNQVRLVSITEVIDDTHEGQLQLLFKGSFAEYEKAVIRERANLGRVLAAKEGKWLGGAPPYSYRLDRQSSKLLINDEEAHLSKVSTDLYVALDDRVLQKNMTMRRTVQNRRASPVTGTARGSRFPTLSP